MKPPAEIQKQDVRDDKLGPGDQFVRQVEDESLPASQVLQDQQSGRQPADAAPVFVP